MLSGPFRIGGYRWRIKYYPDGSHPEDAGYVSLALFLDEDNVLAEPLKVIHRFSFTNRDRKHESSRTRTESDADEAPREFSARDAWTDRRFVKRESLEQSNHLKDDCFTVRCDIVIVKDIVDAAVDAAATPFVVVPPSDMHQHLGSLLQSEEGADVTFEVGGETFAAHRCVLAARSTVFKELFCSVKPQVFTACLLRFILYWWCVLLRFMTKHTTSGAIRIDDMEARVFRMLLAFIYSDSVLETEEKGDDGGVVWQNLLVAADRYDLQRLKLICEEKLCGYIDVTTVETILVLAEQYCCPGLKEACLDFFRSPANLQQVMAIGGLDHLTRTCPSVVKEVIAKIYEGIDYRQLGTFGGECSVL